jgi:hypothetical protein
VKCAFADGLAESQRVIVAWGKRSAAPGAQRRWPFWLKAKFTVVERSPAKARVNMAFGQTDPSDFRSCGVAAGYGEKWPTADYRSYF